MTAIRKFLSYMKRQVWEQFVYEHWHHRSCSCSCSCCLHLNCLFVCLSPVCGVFAVNLEANYVSRVYEVNSYFVVLIYGTCSVMCHGKRFVVLTLAVFEVFTQSDIDYIRGWCVLLATWNLMLINVEPLCLQGKLVHSTVIADCVTNV